jgi:uncharacterized protein
MNNKLFILDTVVLIQAMLSGTCGAYRALQKADNNGIIIVSQEALEELEDKIKSPKFDKYQSIEKRIKFFHSFRNLALLIDPKIIIEACRDPKDDKFLSLAISVGADYIVTRDNDLLCLHPFQNIPIITTGEFLAIEF